MDDLDQAYAEAAADVFAFQESTAKVLAEIEERRRLSEEFDRVLAHACRTLLRWNPEKSS